MLPLLRARYRTYPAPHKVPCISSSQNPPSSLGHHYYDFCHCWGLNVCVLLPPSPNHILKSQSHWDGIRRWGLWRWSGHEGRALMNGISALINDMEEIISTTWRHSKNVAFCKQGRGPSPDTESAGTLILGLAPRTVRNKFLLFKPPSLWSFVIETLTTKIIIID